MPKAAAKRKARNDASNARSLARRGNVKLLSALAEELGLRPVLVKSSTPKVEALVRRLEARCQPSVHLRRLSEAVALYAHNGGIFSAPLLASASGITSRRR